MQNNLMELWSLFNFLQPGLLGEESYFKEEFSRVIVQGGYTNSNERERKVAEKCIKEIKQLIRPHILLRTKEQLSAVCPLPDRKEYVIYCEMTDYQKELYFYFLKAAKARIQEVESRKHFRQNGLTSDQCQNLESLGVLQSLRKICYHPYLFFTFN